MKGWKGKKQAFNGKAKCKAYDCRKPISRLEYEKYNGRCMICGMHDELKHKPLPVTSATNQPLIDAMEDKEMGNNIIKEMHDKLDTSVKDLAIVKEAVRNAKNQLTVLVSNGHMREYDTEKEKLQSLEVTMIKLEERIEFAKEIIEKYN